MATWESTSKVVIWDSRDASIIKSESVILKITDNENDTTLEVGKAIKIHFKPLFGTDPVIHDGTFLGTVSLDGKVYPVIDSSGTRFIVGTGHASNIPATLAESALNASTFTVCFFPGTLIAQPSGECEVEILAPGDLVLNGDSRAVPVKWVGLQTISTRFGPAERLMPVRFVAGSLGGRGGATSSTA